MLVQISFCTSNDENNIHIRTCAGNAEHAQEQVFRSHIATGFTTEQLYRMTVAHGDICSVGAIWTCHVAPLLVGTYTPLYIKVCMQDLPTNGLINFAVLINLTIVDDIIGRCVLDIDAVQRRCLLRPSDK
jgi:hypothetical protein